MYLNDSKVFLTGGTGTLGQALLRVARAEAWNTKFTIFSRDEVKQAQLRALYPEHRYVLGSVHDAQLLRMAMKGHTYVVHAAAYKQVPSAEVNTREAVHTNVQGSINVAEAAIDADVHTVIGISTDKACAPINAYGMTKALMEKLFQAYAQQQDDTRFVLTRYGNVVGSRGSVVPFFREQCRVKHELTLTDERMTRFWLSTQGAVDLIRIASSMPNGTILIPKAPASLVSEMAKAVCILNHPEPVCKQIVTGIRAGEKVHEDLLHLGEVQDSVASEGHFTVYPAGHLHRGERYPEPYRSCAPSLYLGVIELGRMIKAELECGSL